MCALSQCYAKQKRMFVCSHREVLCKLLEERACSRIFGNSFLSLVSIFETKTVSRLISLKSNRACGSLVEVRGVHHIIVDNFVRVENLNVTCASICEILQITGFLNPKFYCILEQELIQRIHT